VRGNSGLQIQNEAYIARYGVSFIGYSLRDSFIHQNAILPYPHGEEGLQYQRTMDEPEAVLIILPEKMNQTE